MSGYESTLLKLAHIQQDDSLVPLLPYAAGCFLASVLLTISGIAETHPQALSLATYLIQCGWLLLQIQGTELVQKFGSQDQTQALFYVWMLSIYALDVHRRLLNSSKIYQSMDVKQLLPSKQQSHLVQGNMTLTALETCYSMVCHVVPMLCRISSSALENRTVSDAETSVTVSLWATKTSRTQLINKPGPLLAAGGIPGMQEMEDLVLFEVAAGLVASAIMLVAWLVMTLRQGGNRSATMRTASARWRRAIKTIQGHGHDLRVLTEAKLDAFVDNLKFRIE